MIYLLGIDHQVQYQKKTQISMVFGFYLSKKVKDLNTVFIAEEWSEDSSKINHIETTVPQDIAKKYNIEHMYCDPDGKERKIIGIPNQAEIKSQLNITGLVLEGDSNHGLIIAEAKKYYSIREKFWLDKIKGKLKHNMIFVCGSDHLVNFRKLLSINGYQAKILPKRFDIVSYLQSQNKDLYK